MTEQLKASKFQKNNNDVDNADDIDFARYFNLLLESKFLIATITSVFAVAGIIFALLQTPIYKADALIQIEKKSSAVPGLGDFEEVFGAGNNDAETELVLLKSRKVMGYAVEELNLDWVAKPKYFGKLGKMAARRHFGNEFNSPWYSIFLSDDYAWGGESIRVSKMRISDKYRGVMFNLIYQGKNSYTLERNEQTILSGKVGEVAKDSSGDIELLISELKAEQGTAFIVGRRYREDVVAELKRSVQEQGQGKDTGVLTLALEGEDRAKIKKVLDTIADGFLLQNVQRMSQEVEKSIEFLNQELPKVDQQQMSAEEALNQYRLENDSVDLTLETESVLDQLVELDTKIHELSFIEVDIAQKYTKEHPRYVSLLAKKSDLEAQKQRLNDSIKTLPKAQQEILRMARDVEVNQQIYLALLNKVQELNVVKASTVGNINIVDRAEVGRFPIKPKKALIVVIITMLGGFLAVAFVILKAAFHRGVTNPQEFEDVGLTVYATIPLSEEHVRRTQVNKLKDKVSSNRRRKQANDLLALVNPSDMAVEAIRSLRTSLHFAMLEAKNNVVMISGASPEVGKSFVSSNLAAVIAQSGQKVLVIDGDMRKGYIQKIFNQKFENGLSDLLIGDINYSEVIKETAVENLHLVTRGQIPPNPSELLMSENFTKFIEQASKDYDLVVIDTPPILAVTDAAIIGNQAGTTLMLARYDMSPLKEIITGANRFDLNGVEIKGLIFNAVEKRNSDYGYYNYGYEYK
ncbi:polysaccharide biosynthesis tyrosine autokinase [Thalassotalea crassostreae]|uniref:polysaccharide biosynthesis tyrosine autokinase n=1 Tax=Thalassotalea crassostreae TaxID=1763536 RepID=UPI000839013C|nr:polysaccharide biosynthesis tyrosine autokinase [Thalassotalea crassostreae]